MILTPLNKFVVFVGQNRIIRYETFEDGMLDKSMHMTMPISYQDQVTKRKNYEFMFRYNKSTPVYSVYEDQYLFVLYYDKAQDENVVICYDMGKILT